GRSGTTDSHCGAQHRRRLGHETQTGCRGPCAGHRTPTFAAEYYVIQSASNKKCSIASKKPTSDKMTLVGDGTAYKTKKEARPALKAAAACKACPPVARPRPGIEPPATRRTDTHPCLRDAHPCVGRARPGFDNARTPVKLRASSTTERR